MGPGETVRTARDVYTLEARVGGGLAGAVFQARDRGGVRHALKILADRPTPFQTDGFRREIAFGYRRLHPNIVAVEDDGLANGVPFFVMPYYETTLGEAMKTRMPLPRAVRYFEQADAAIDAAHRAGIAHRDVKPENLLIGSDDTLVVADWGTADFDAAERLAALPAATRARLTGRGTHGTAADAYALGLILFELLTGAPLDPAAIRPAIVAPPGFAYLDERLAALLDDRNRIAHALVG